MTSSPVSHVPALVLGAGLTGLHASIELASAGVPRRIFEKQRRHGGHAITVEESGYRFDRTGHLLHLRHADLRERVLGWLDGDVVRVRRRSRIWSNGVYTRYPFQANTFGLPPDVAYECLHGFIKAHFDAKDREPRDFEEFCRMHFGDGISRHFMIPYNSRLWGVHPREITSAWCQRFVPLPKLEDVLAGAVGKNDRELGYNTEFLYPRLGIGALSDALAREAGSIDLGSAPKAIDPRARRVHFASETVEYQALVSTIPLPVLIGLLVDPPRAVAEAARRLRCTHLYYLDVALSAPAGHDAHWIYVPEARYPFYRVGCYSHFSAEMAPPGRANLYVELADRAEPDLPALLPVVARGLTEMGVIAGPDAIAFARLRKIDYAYVIFDHAYFPALETIQRYLDEVGIVSAGRYGGWNYSAMEDALVFGRDAAAKARELCG